MRLQIAYAGLDLTAEVDLPDDPARASDLIPALQVVADLLGDRVRDQWTAAGHPPSCGPGCGACCSQLVPVCEPEMHALARLVDGMDPARSGQVRDRLGEIRDRLERAGLIESLHRPPPASEAYTSLMHAYSALGEPCPFLVDQSCSIHPHRPMICRDFYVTTPPAWCDDPSDPRIAVVRPEVYLTNAVASALGRQLGRKVKVTPLSLALEWADDHPEELLTWPALDVFRAILDQVARSTGGRVRLVLGRPREVPPILGARS